MPPGGALANLTCINTIWPKFGQLSNHLAVTYELIPNSLLDYILFYHNLSRKKFLIMFLSPYHFLSRTNVLTFEVLNRFCEKCWNPISENLSAQIFDFCHEYVIMKWKVWELLEHEIKIKWNSGKNPSLSNFEPNNTFKLIAKLHQLPP